MTLSLDDVRNKRFRMARKGGYEVLEVDEFVDEVEESFGQLTEENATLKKQVDALRSGSPDPAVELAAGAPDAAPTESSVFTAPVPEAVAPAQAAVAAPGLPAPQGERVVVTTSAEASTAVVRLVQLSTEQAEHLVREAHEEAGQIREDASRTAQQMTEDARARAERLESEAQSAADRVETEAQTRSQSLDQELTQRRTELLSDLDRQRGALTQTVGRLRDFEQQYRSSLHDHLRGQLDTLEHVGLEPKGGPESTGGEQPAGPVADAGVSEGGSSQSVHAGPVPEGDGSSEGTASETPRLDALLGEQR